MNLDEKKVLQRASRLRVDIASSSNIHIQVGDQVVVSGSHGLAVLDAFSQPITVSQAMKKLRGRASGMQDWIDLISTVAGLYETGVLLEPTAIQPEILSHRADFSSAPIHLPPDSGRRSPATRQSVRRQSAPSETGDVDRRRTQPRARVPTPPPAPHRR